MKTVLGVLAGCLVATHVAAADPALHWPFDFDPSIAADPTGTGAKIATGNATYPLMPLDRMTPLVSDAVTLYYWPETAAMLERLRINATAAPMTWPLTTAMCTAHAAFSIPTILTANPTATCTAADASIRADLTDLGACQDVEFPELYVLAYDPANAEAQTDNIVDMIGQAGQAWTHAAAPQQGLLPDDWIPTMRVILDKLRNDALVAHLTTAHQSYDSAISALAANSTCFDPTAAAQLTASLQALDAELDARSAYLAQIAAAGTATANQENVCLAAQSRVRNPLTYPTLTRAEREWLAFWVGGTYWRMRGGGLIPLPGTQDARWYFVDQAYSQLGSMLGGQDGIDVAFQLYLPLLLIGWSDWQDMGNAPGADKYDDLVSMSSRGEQQVDGGASLLSGRGYTTLDLTVGGLQMGPGYYRGYYPMQGDTYAQELEPQPPYSDGICGPTCIGEFSMGASMMLGLAHTLLDGKATGQPPTVTLCQNAVCGDDGCGGSCGTCGGGLTCTAGQCVGAYVDAGIDAPSGVPSDASTGPGNGETGSPPGGCCQTSTSGGPYGAVALVGFVALCWRRRRRR